MAKDPTQARSKSKSATLLFLLGFALLATGVGFAAAPQYSWRVTQIAHQAAAFGVQNGVLALGGLVLIGLGIVARSIAAPRTEAPTDNPLEGELALLNEQVSTKLGQLRTSTLQLSENLSALSAQQHAHFQQQAEQRQSSSGDHQQDALFRLAASLDKLNAHLDERIHGLDLLLRTGFENLLAELRRTPALRPDVAPARHEAPAQRVAASGHGPTHGQSHAPEGAIDFYETMQKLDAIAGASEPNRGAPTRQQPQAPFPVQGGEALDVLLPEDYRKPY